MTRVAISTGGTQGIGKTAGGAPWSSFYECCIDRNTGLSHKTVECWNSLSVFVIGIGFVARSQVSLLALAQSEQGQRRQSSEVRPEGCN